jgi:hypothetical protein
MPTSTYRSKERTPPEVEELTLLLATAVEVTPEIAPLLVLGAVTGTRRGELVAIRRSAISCQKNQITVDTSITSKGQVKSTKTRRERTFHVDAETIAMLQRHCDHMNDRVRQSGVELKADPFLFSLVADCSEPMPPDHFSKRVGVLKSFMGIENKRPEVAAPRRRGSTPSTIPCLAPSTRHERTRAQRRNVPQRDRPATWPKSTLGQPGNRYGRTSGEGCGVGSVQPRFRRVHSCSTQIHLIRTSRRGVQRQHGGAAARIWPPSLDAPLFQVPSVVRQTGS